MNAQARGTARRAVTGHCGGLDPRTIKAGLAEAHRDIAGLVADALETGGPTWAVAAPLVETLVGACWTGSPPVALARALAATQGREAAAAARLLDTGDTGGAGALRDRVCATRDRLAHVLRR